MTFKHYHVEWFFFMSEINSISLVQIEWNDWFWRNKREIKSKKMLKQWCMYRDGDKRAST